MRSGCATALVLNKWDLAEDVDLDYERARAHKKLRLRPRVLTASAKTGRHVERAAGRGDRARRPPRARGSRRRSSTASCPRWSPRASRRRPAAGRAPATA